MTVDLLVPGVARAGQAKSIGRLGVRKAEVAGFDPSSVPNLVGWFDPHVFAVADGTAIGTFPDASPAGNALGQATGTARPAWRDAANGINGHPALSFDGGDSLLSGTIASMADLTIVAVIRTSSDVTNARTFVSANASQQVGFVQTGLLRLNAGSAVSSALAIAATTNYVVTCQFNQGASFARVNGVQSGAINPGSNSSTVLQLGTGGGVSWNGLLGIVFFVARAASAQEIADLEAYAAAAYGL